MTQVEEQSATNDQETVESQGGIESPSSCRGVGVDGDDSDSESNDK